MATKTKQWTRTDHALPERGVVVMTKIDDECGCRNEQRLKLLKDGGKLWFHEDGKTYVYYVPTHWKPL